VKSEAPYLPEWIESTLNGQNDIEEDREKETEFDGET
jgi:hypothetical protein